MCWSAPVSFLFGAIDTLMISFLLWRRRGRDVTYASALGCVACQEWAQLAVWSTGSAVVSTQDDECTVGKAAIGFGMFAGSSSLPAVLVWRSVVDSRGKQQVENGREERLSRRQVKALLLWFSASLLVLVATVITESYCVMVGPRHHQVWICAQSIYDLGGFPLYFAVLAMYAFANAYGLLALELPRTELFWIGSISFACGVVSYGFYFYSLEACSIWCWSAFSIGVYMCLRPLGKDD